MFAAVLWVVFHFGATSKRHAAILDGTGHARDADAHRAASDLPGAAPGASGARQPLRPDMIWPKPIAVSFDPAACSEPPLELRGARLEVAVRRGFAAGAREFVDAAFQLALSNWGCLDGGGAAAAGAAAGERPSAWARGPLVAVAIADAGCVTPDCYTEESDESYLLRVTSSGVEIESPTLFGVNWAFSTLAALAARSCAAACAPVTVADRPAFGHRGLLIDTARNFVPIDDLRSKLIDVMHLSKLNVLHWHIYDAQSQPLEVRFDPRLWRPYSSSQRYTQAEARALVDYAFRRGVRVLPELDMPGHTASFAKADPSWVACNMVSPWDRMCAAPPCGQLKPEMVGLAVDLVKEMLAVFPNRIVSTGADEVNFNCWNGAVVELNSTAYPDFWQVSVHKLMTFQAKIASTLAAAERTFAVWDESWETWRFGGTPALPRGSVLLAWRSNASQIAAATAAGYKVVVMPRHPYYLDCGWGPKAPHNWCKPLKTWLDIYRNDPLAGVGEGQGNTSLVLGGAVSMWSEHIRPAVLDYIVWPRAAALGESLWSRPLHTEELSATKKRLGLWIDQVTARGGVRMSPLDWDGKDIRYFLFPEWCDHAPPQLNRHGRDYCAGAQVYKGVPLTFENLVGPPLAGGKGGRAKGAAKRGRAAKAGARPGAS